MLEDKFPRVAEVVVAVRDTQGQPVNGVLVTFEVEPDWAKAVTVRPRSVMTQRGIARAVLEPGTTGYFHVMAQVENVTEKIGITVLPSPNIISPNAD